MNDLSEYFPTAEQIEQRAAVLALGLLVAVGDAKAAAERLKELTAETARYREARDSAEKGIAEAAALHDKLEAGNADLAERTTRFQAWADQTEAAYREREARILANERRHDEREAKLAEGEAALARRIAEHDSFPQATQEQSR